MKKFLLTIASLSFIGFCMAQDYKYLGEYTADGTPMYFAEKDEVSAETLEMVSNALPEGFPVPLYNPQYITSGYDTDIILTSEADVWVTFVGEGAGYRNVLGFYTYDITDLALTKPQPEDITIIFPNVSAKGSGGSLEVGHKVNIGSFNANTAIGWVLLANGWDGSKVTPGLWQLYSGTEFNPELDPVLKYHNVLLNDDANERVILGFEDIRRDYASCDQDFNDALFYITANPYNAIKTNNFNKITDHAPVSSGNDGGLESNGDLASLIAKRNFDRTQNNSAKNSLKTQVKYNKQTYKSLGAKSGNLDAYFPATGMFGTESTYVSSPEDLLDITNAENVFSIDYYEGTDRVSAALATETAGSVYNHTKTICDRLNNSQLLDVRMVTLQGHDLVYSQLLRDNGTVEYALTFSIKDEGSVNRLYSLWNISDYPEGNYTNFQVWGNSMGQVATLVNHIMHTFNQEKQLSSTKRENVLPTVFIKKGKYENGKLHLSMINKVGASWLNIDGNYKTTEHAKETSWNTIVDLSGEWEEEVVVDTGYLFDIGISIFGENSYQNDHMYLADGPWGADFDENVDSLENFEITEENGNDEKDGIYAIERGVMASGQVRNTLNIFRNVLAGDLRFNIENYKSLHFKIENDRPIEVSLVTDATENWEERLRYTIDAHSEITPLTISFSDFKDDKGNTPSFSELKTIVFSVQGDYQQYSSFYLQINDLILSDGSSSTEEGSIVLLEDLKDIPGELVEEELKSLPLRNYPNPFTEYTIISLPNSTDEVAVFVTNMQGRTVFKSNLETNNGNEVKLRLDTAPNGIYIYTLVDSNNQQTYQGKLLKN